MGTDLSIFLLRQFKLVWLVLSILLCFVGGTALGAQVEGLFNAEVEVFDRSSQERKAGIRKAFEKVLIKVSGNRNVVFVPGIIPEDQEIETLVEQFGYSEIERIEEDISSEDDMADMSLSTPEEAEPEPSLVLWVGFDSGAVLRRLQQVNLPVWDKTRPLSLLWLVVQEESSRYLFEPETHLELRETLETQAAERGLPLAFPLMDLEDTTALTPTDVWGDFSDVVNTASQRYRADSVIVGRLNHFGEGFWHARWTLYEGGEAQRWETQGEGQHQVLEEGIHGVADILARRYAQVLLTDLEPPLMLILEGVADFKHYARAVTYLESLTQIATMAVQRVAENRVEFKLSLRGSRAGFEQVLALGDVLQKVEITETAPAVEVVEDPLDAAESMMKKELVGETVERSPLVYRLVP